MKVERLTCDGAPFTCWSLDAYIAVFFALCCPSYVLSVEHLYAQWSLQRPQFSDTGLEASQLLPSDDSTAVGAG